MSFLYVERKSNRQLGRSREFRRDVLWKESVFRTPHLSLLLLVPVRYAESRSPRLDVVVDLDEVGDVHLELSCNIAKRIGAICQPVCSFSCPGAFLPHARARETTHRLCSPNHAPPVYCASASSTVLQRLKLPRIQAAGLRVFKNHVRAS